MPGRMATVYGVMTAGAPRLESAPLCAEMRPLKYVNVAIGRRITMSVLDGCVGARSTRWHQRPRDQRALAKPTPLALLAAMARACRHLLLWIWLSAADAALGVAANLDIPHNVMKGMSWTDCGYRLGSPRRNACTRVD